MAWIWREVGAAGLVVLAALAGASSAAAAQGIDGAPPPASDTGEVRAEIRWTAGFRDVVMVGSGGTPATPGGGPAPSEPGTCQAVKQESFPPQYNVYCQLPEGVVCQDASVDLALAGARFGGASAAAGCGTGDGAEAACDVGPLGPTSARAATGCQDAAAGTGQKWFSCHAAPRGPATPYGSVTCRTVYVSS